MKLLVLVLLMFSLNSISQNNKVESNSVEFFANPFFQRFGDMTKQYTVIDHPNFKVDYIKSPAFEFGLKYHHKFNVKWGFGIGSSLQFSRYRTFFFMSHPMFPSSIFHPTYREAKVQYFSLRLSATYQLLERIRLNASFNAYVPYKEIIDSESSPHGNFHLTTFSNGIFYYDLKIYEPGYVGVPDLIPELSANFEIIPNLDLSVGIRMKFWELSHDFHYKIVVEGSAEPENYGQRELLFESKENSKVMGYFFGLSYRLPLCKHKPSVHDIN